MCKCPFPCLYLAGVLNAPQVLIGELPVDFWPQRRPPALSRIRRTSINASGSGVFPRRPLSGRGFPSGYITFSSHAQQAKLRVDSGLKHWRRMEPMQQLKCFNIDTYFANGCSGCYITFYEFRSNDRHTIFISGVYCGNLKYEFDYSVRVKVCCTNKLGITSKASSNNILYEKACPRTIHSKQTISL